MPYIPSPQIRKLLRKGIRRPNYNSEYATCFKCGSRALLPRQGGNICGRCNRELHDKVMVDKQTKALMKRFKTRRRFRY